MPRTRSLAWAELKIGIVSIVAIAIAAFVIFLLGGNSGFPWQRYTLKAMFTYIAGLKTGAPVKTLNQAMKAGWKGSDAFKEAIGGGPKH